MQQQYQITQIENGWLVATPPTTKMGRNGQPIESPPIAHFCSGRAEVIEYLTSIWPSELKVG